jgi:hypothetical protein
VSSSIDPLELSNTHPSSLAPIPGIHGSHFSPTGAQPDGRRTDGGLLPDRPATGAEDELPRRPRTRTYPTADNSTVITLVIGNTQYEARQALRVSSPRGEARRRWMTYVVNEKNHEERRLSSWFLVVCSLLILFDPQRRPPPSSKLLYRYPLRPQSSVLPTPLSIILP